MLGVIISVIIVLVIFVIAVGSYCAYGPAKSEEIKEGKDIMTGALLVLVFFIFLYRIESTIEDVNHDLGIVKERIKKLNMEICGLEMELEFINLFGTIIYLNK